MLRLLRGVFSIVIVAAASIAAPGAAAKKDPLARYVKAADWIATPDGAIYVELIVDGEAALVRYRQRDEKRPHLTLFSTPAEALAFLLSRDTAFLSVPLKAWAGPDLQILRDRLIAGRKIAFETKRPVGPVLTTAQSAVREPVRALLQYTGLLTQVGRSAEAEAILRQRLAEMQPKTDKSWSALEWLTIASALANVRRDQEDYAGSIAYYKAIEKSLASGPYAVNATVNRAALLAEVGQYAEALTVIEQASAAFARQNTDRRSVGDPVPGSDRHFAWIRACALNGLGRSQEAKTQLTVLAKDRTLQDKRFLIDPDNSLILRSSLCMKDYGALKSFLLSEIRTSPVSTAYVWMQPAYKPRGPAAGLIQKLRDDPEMQNAVRGKMVVLPAELTGALNGWR